MILKYIVVKKQSEIQKVTTKDNVMLIKKRTMLVTSLLSLSLVGPVVLANDSINTYLLQGINQPDFKLKIDENNRQVNAAIKQGLISPISELYRTVESQLHGRIVEIELDKDDNQWVYELKLYHDNKIIEAEYNAKTLELTSLSANNLFSIIKK